MKWLDPLTSVLAGHALLARLGVASLELAVSTWCLAGLLRFWRPRSPRLLSLLWLIVLVKPLASLALGAPIAFVRFEAPAEVSSQTMRAPAAEFPHDLVALEASREDLA